MRRRLKKLEERGASTLGSGKRRDFGGSLGAGLKLGRGIKLLLGGDCLVERSLQAPHMRSARGGRFGAADAAEEMAGFAEGDRRRRTSATGLAHQVVQSRTGTCFWGRGAGDLALREMAGRAASFGAGGSAGVAHRRLQ